jgi:transposase-like protein
MPLSRTVAPYAQPTPHRESQQGTDSTDTTFFIPVNNRIEADHGQLKRRLRPMRHLRNDRTATVIIAGHAFVQNLRRGHYRLTDGVPSDVRLAAAFDELRHAI